MSRIKTVYPTDEVFHLWANRAVQHDIRNPSGNVSTRNMGNVLCSYGEHFAIAGYYGGKDGATLLLLINDDKHSTTTSKQQCQARRALPKYRMDGAVHVPSLRASSFSDAGMIIAADSARLQAYELLEKSNTQRDTGNRGVSLNKARDYFESARKILEAIGDAKAAAKIAQGFGVHMDKAAVLAFLQNERKADYLAYGKAAIAACTKRADEMRARVDDVAMGRPTGWDRDLCRRVDNPSDVLQHLGDLARDIKSGIEWYAKAGSKPAPALVRLNAECARHIEFVKPHAKRFDNASNLARAKSDIVRAFELCRNNSFDLYRFSNYGSSIHGALGLHKREAGTPDGFALPDAYLWAAERALRMAKGAKLRNTLEVMGRQLVSGNFERVEVSMRTARDAQQTVIESQNANLAKWAAPRITAYIDALTQYEREKAAREYAQNAERIEQWRNGAAVSVPRTVPTMARIKDDTVQTSLGASVPLAHAVRLIRITERVAQRGGQSWDAGTGPKVGHYTLNHIGPDMSAIIGCHTFSAEESARIVAQVKAHAAWGEVSADSTESA